MQANQADSQTHRLGLFSFLLTVRRDPVEYNVRLNGQICTAGQVGQRPQDQRPAETTVALGLKIVVGNRDSRRGCDVHTRASGALNIVACDPDALTASEIALCWSTCLARLPELRRLTAVRAVLARAVEALVLLDRAAFLLEVREELTSPPPAVVALLPLFDPVISPRSVAVVALRDDPIIAQNRPGCSPHEQA